MFDGECHNETESDKSKEVSTQDKMYNREAQ